MSYSVELIKWKDHSGFTTGSWHSLENTIEDLTPFVVETIGFVVKETEEYIIIVGTISENDNTQGEFCVIKSCIVSRDVLRNG